MIDLGNEFKKIEKNFEKVLDGRKFTLLRLDGSKFHKLSKNFIKPFDLRVILALLTAAKRLNHKFSRIITFVYAQSDEISLLIHPVDFYLKHYNLEHFTFPFNLRLEKLVSISASVISCEFKSAFNELTEFQELFELNKKILEKLDVKLHWHKLNDNPYFDSRVFQLSDLEQVKKYFTWRRIDAIRNSKNSVGFYVIDQKTAENMTSNQLIDKVLDIKGFDYFSMPSLFKVGGYLDLFDLELWKEFEFNELDDLSKNLIKKYVLN